MQQGISQRVFTLMRLKTNITNIHLDTGSCLPGDWRSQWCLRAFPFHGCMQKKTTLSLTVRAMLFTPSAAAALESIGDVFPLVFHAPGQCPWMWWEDHLARGGLLCFRVESWLRSVPCLQSSVCSVSDERRVPSSPAGCSQLTLQRVLVIFLCDKRGWLPASACQPSAVPASVS